MASILVYTSPARGHLYPVMGVALELRRRGHRVQVRTLAAEVAKVEALGLEAAPIDPAVEARELDDWQARSPLKALGRSMTTFADRALHEIGDVQRAIADSGAGALLVDTNSWGAQAVAEASGLPWATFQPYFTPLPAEGVPPFGPGFRRATGPAGSLRDLAVRPMVTGQMSRLALPGINAARARVGLAPLDGIAAFLERPPRVLYFTVPELDYPRQAWPPGFRFVGPGTWGPPAQEPAWLASIDRPIVLVTCSTERQADGAILEAALAGLPGDGYFVVGTSAAFRPEEVAAAPTAHTRVERFIPHDAVLPRATVVVCHGGMGITQRALSFGVPVVVVPFGRDQLEVARRVEAAGAGARLAARRLTPERLRTAVGRARPMASGARRIAAAFSRVGASAGADAFEEILVR
jgi:MGT family glycosyltransferase